MRNKFWWRAAILIIIAAQLLAACGPRATPAPASEGTSGEVPSTASTATMQPSDGMEATPTETGMSSEETQAPEEPTETGEGAVSAPSTTRTGGWLDTITIVEEAQEEAAVSRIEAGEVDLHAQQMADPEIFAQVQQNLELAHVFSTGASDEITFNPAGPVFEGTGKLNPFASRRLREAMNWLIDRNYISQEVMGGLGKPKVLPLMSGFPDYVRYLEKAREIEANYAYDPERATQIVNEEMEAMGAEQVNGQWQYEGEPIELIGIIRVEDERREIGDYFANQLETLGFMVKREYKTSSEASPIWLQGDPNDGLFHFYTGGWVANWVQQDEGSNFDDYYTTRSPIGSPLWLAYTPDPEFDEIANALKRNLYTSLDERKDLFERAMEMAVQDAVRVWVVDELSYSPMRSNVEVAGDLAASIQGGQMWPYTLRLKGEEGGELTMSNTQIIVDPWNPVGGSNFVTDAMAQRATSDRAALMDPFTGLAQPQRMERAEISVVEGQPIAATLDWINVTSVAENPVPEDAWVDWDATEQRWITAGEKFPDGITARAKLTAYYPEDVYDITWHDGSQFSVADLVMNWIMGFDPGKAESAIYDESVVPIFEATLETFKGYRIVSEQPLIIEKYTDIVYPTAEDNFYQNLEFWVEYTYGIGAWHNVALGVLAEAEQELAFTSAKADDTQLEWMSYISGPSLDILNGHLQTAASEGYIPYEATLGQFITAEDAQTRWDNLQAWYADHGHFWIGTGPYYLDQVFTVENQLVLKHFEGYPDPADRWAIFAEPQFPEVEIDGPGRVTIGEEAAFDVYISFEGREYAVDDISVVKFLVYDSEGQLVLSNEATPLEDGLWQITLSAEETEQLPAGSNRLEVAAASKLVSFPTFTTLDFVTVP